MFARQKIQEESYKLKNLLLGFPSDWFVDKKTLKKLKRLLIILHLQIKVLIHMKVIFIIVR